jgi:Domain of unknown function DUF29
MKKARKDLYETDFYTWTQAQVEALQSRQWDHVDLEHLIEEVRDLGSEQEHAVESQLARLLQHLLKWSYQPTHQSPSWRRSIIDARQQIARRLRRNKGLRSRVATFMPDAYRDARRKAEIDTGLPLATFPEECPWPLKDVLNEGFLPPVAVAYSAIPGGPVVHNVRRRGRGRQGDQP